MTHDVNSLAGHFGDLLARREAELRAALETDKKNELAAEEAASGEVQDFKDLAERELQSGMAVLDTERTLEELSQVVAARRRLQEGHYGRCLRCSKPIDLRRLEALPSARFCVACQTTGEEAPGGHR
ncbi:MULTISPECIES: TraR/DksA C4-type zinc finger protein [unclassified Polaromonas]|uniref:TraR/DksA family transcriptional regulator n=1 Tax=unclassified Polaromonas TaxID=2638319 RepID=UPI000F085CBF|nr:MULTISPECIES: TraR/DksA C4-type zinc finger protein [unclassified Polaromonas]AYQ29485.1 TraR/DksA family transcriptional regulator [Polaromonas sp. SP1]QGJ19399.1 molecular chaperone DnaK [Polaromonas sp. Pch-P]